MARCIEDGCSNEAQRGSNLCSRHGMEGRAVLYFRTDLWESEGSEAAEDPGEDDQASESDGGRCES
jgi:hypothetical protein